MTTFQPDGPRADAQVTVLDPALGRSYFWEADADSAAYAAADELGHIDKYATVDEI